MLAHRYYYEKLRGPIPEGMQIDHLCRLPACVNPDHLEVVTPTQNVRRGRSAKLTESTAFGIRWAALTTTLFHRDIGEMFGVDKSAVAHVLHGRHWRLAADAGARARNLALWDQAEGPKPLGEVRERKAG